MAPRYNILYITSCKMVQHQIDITVGCWSINKIKYTANNPNKKHSTNLRKRWSAKHFVTCVHMWVRFRCVILHWWAWSHIWIWTHFYSIGNLLFLEIHIRRDIGTIIKNSKDEWKNEIRSLMCFEIVYDERKRGRKKKESEI